MADHYARHALSQRASFEATHPAVMAAAERLASKPVLCVADLGAADGVNSHGLIRDLMAQRAGQSLIYALVDLPTNAWRVVADHLRDAFGPAEDQGVMVVIPAQAESGPGVVDTGTGAHYASPEAHGEACRRALDRDPPPATVISMAGIPLHEAPSFPRGTAHLAVTGTSMHWIADAAEDVGQDRGAAPGVPEKAFGTPGTGGSFAMADPDTGVGFGYVMNRLGFHLWSDPRELALRHSLFHDTLDARPQT